MFPSQEEQGTFLEDILGGMIGRIVALPPSQMANVFQTKYS